MENAGTNLSFRVTTLLRLCLATKGLIGCETHPRDVTVTTGKIYSPQIQLSIRN